MTTRQTAPLHGADDGSGTPVLLLHPVGLDHRCWDAVVLRLPTGYRVLRPDLPGHGHSPALSGTPDLAAYAAAVAEWCHGRQAIPAVVVGLSFGGMIAQTLALEHAGMVQALVVAGCPAGFPDPAVRAAIDDRGQAALAGGMAAILEPTLDRWFTPGFRASGGDAPTRARLLSDDAAGWAAAWRAISGLDLAHRLPEIGVPTLCIAGESDAAAPPPLLQGIADAIPGARMAILPRAPHMMQIETPDAFAARLSEFLAGLEDRRNGM